MKSLPTAWLITPQAPDWTWSGYDAIQPQDLVIAIDGGLLRCMELGLKVDYLCGDMDSIADGWQQHISPDRVWRFDPYKNETDNELAIQRLLQMNFQRMQIINNMGGRVDHLLGLIQNLLYAHRQGVMACLENANQRAFFLPRKWQAMGLKGCKLSLVAYGTSALFEASEGLEWSLKSLALYPHLSRGISNDIIADKVSISLENGDCLAVLTKLS
ncbi:MAG: thiamine diphosphokinase [Candidatus Cloacimonetes bacterium]|nr:thiamine diphosphokinase [Candidatus Cloacimonadota bacterium]